MECKQKIWTNKITWTMVEKIFSRVKSFVSNKARGRVSLWGRESAGSFRCLYFRKTKTAWNLVLCANICFLWHILCPTQTTTLRFDCTEKLSIYFLSIFQRTMMFVEPSTHRYRRQFSAGVSPRLPNFV